MPTGWTAGPSRRGRLHPPLRLRVQSPPALPLRGHRRPVRLRHPVV